MLPPQPSIGSLSPSEYPTLKPCPRGSTVLAFQTSPVFCCPGDNIHGWQTLASVSDTVSMPSYSSKGVRRQKEPGKLDAQEETEEQDHIRERIGPLCTHKHTRIPWSANQLLATETQLAPLHPPSSNFAHPAHPSICTCWIRALCAHGPSSAPCWSCCWLRVPWLAAAAGSLTGSSSWRKSGLISWSPWVLLFQVKGSRWGEEGSAGAMPQTHQLLRGGRKRTHPR